MGSNRRIDLAVHNRRRKGALIYIELAQSNTVYIKQIEIFKC